MSFSKKGFLFGSKVVFRNPSVGKLAFGQELKFLAKPDAYGASVVADRYT